MDAMRAVIERHHVDVVFNLATRPLGNSFTDPRGAYMTSVDIAVNLAELLRGGAFGRLVHYSTSEIYGDALVAPMPEDHPTRPTTPYAAGKLAADVLLQSWIELFRIPVLTIRPFNNYGPRQNDRDYGAVIPVTIRRIASGQAPILEGTGDQTRDFTFVRDTVRLTADLCETEAAWGQTLNVACAREVRIRDLIEAICREMGYTGDFEHRPARPGDHRRHLASTERARRLVSFGDLTPIDTGIADIARAACLGSTACRLADLVFSDSLRPPSVDARPTQLIRSTSVLVTGGTGFLGRALLQRIAGRHEIFALARNPGVAPIIAGVEWIEGDLRRPLAHIRLPRRVGAVVHLASVREPSDGAGPEELFTVNAGATAALVDYAAQAGARRFVYGSTGGVYGYRAGRIRETNTPAPFDLYTLSKWHGETVITREHRLSTAVLRYFFPYGPGQRAGIVPRLASSLKESRPVTLYRQGRVPHLNPVFVDDAAELTRLALASSQDLVLNCAGTDVVTVRELARRMAAILDVTPQFVSGRDPRVGDMVASVALSARQLNFTPSVRLDAGLQRTLLSPA